MENKFKQLRVSGWRQFDGVDIEFHESLTVLTGANGAGKTTLLNLLTRHFGWSRPLLSTPFRDSDGNIRYLTGAIAALKAWFLKSPPPTSEHRIGEITYTSNQVGKLYVPAGQDVQYNVEIKGQQDVSGLYVPSHRIVSPYQVISSIPTTGISAGDAFSAYRSEVYNRYEGAHSGRSPAFRMKEALISMATFGAGNEYVKGRPELLKSYLGFVEILRQVLPVSLGFERLEIRTPDIVVITKTGEFLVDSLSGGLAAIVDLAWQIYTFSVEHRGFAVVIDEPENHLHPSMQREVMPSLVRAFPNVQFVVATHSPFVVTAARDSNVYVLDYRAQDGTSQAYAPAKSVISLRLDQVNKAAPAGDVLKTVLGMDSTLPTWAAAELDRIVEEFSNGQLSRDAVIRLKNRLSGIGLDNAFPSAMNAVFDRKATT